MYTRCKACHTVYPLNAALLAQAGGRFRCGKCKQTGNALDSLFDEWPAAGAEPPEAGELPELGITLDLEGAGRSFRRGEPGQNADEDPHFVPSARRGSWMIPATWIGGAVLLVAIVGWYLLDYFGASPPGPASEPRSEAAAFRDLTKIDVLHRQMRQHPERAGVLLLSATIVNRAVRAQPFPSLEVRLLDASGRPVDRRHFAPGEYLAADTDRGGEISPQAFLTLSLEVEDPGPEAVGFELRFH